ncbi:MAG: DUF4390 domain-containing protein [Deltaproteobacteria bacterium]|nr:DUF4390 domain-containing protein [Deltaproteobacteria bacterium]
MKNIILYSLYLLAALVLFAPDVCSADGEAYIAGLSVSGSDDLSVSFVVRDAFTKDMEDALKSGLPIAFAFTVELDRVRSVWFNEALGAWEFRHVVRYDTLKDEYVVSRDEANGNSGVRTKDLGEMKEIMSALTLARIAPQKTLEAGESYDLRAKATLKASTLPFFLDHVLFFVKAWNIETDWFSYRFSR